MLAQYLVSVGATNLLKSKTKSDKAANSSQVNKERTIHVRLLVENFCIVFQKYVLRQDFRHRLLLNLFLIFHQILGWCSYEIVLVRKEHCICRLEYKKVLN